MWGKLLGGPIFLAGMFMPNPYAALGCYGVGLVLAAAYLGPSLAVTHSLVRPGMRAMSSAVLFVFLNILGIGLGPMFVGMWSDMMNDIATCPINDVAVQALRMCPTVTDLTGGLIQGGFIPAKTVVATDTLAAAIQGGFDVRPLIDRPADMFSNLTGQIGSAVAALLALTGLVLMAMRKVKPLWGFTIIGGGAFMFLIVAFAAGAFDPTFKNWAFSLRTMFPGMESLGVNKESLRWGMVLCILVTYPMAILWHWGAMARPKGKLDDNGEAVVEAMTEGDPSASKT
jgi:hypothetical protein